jgi:hypothetical protein
MAYKVRCPACEKRVRVPDADLGGQALCPACGARFDVPPAPLLGPENADSASTEYETASSLSSASDNDPGPETRAEAVFLDAVPPTGESAAAAPLLPLIAPEPAGGSRELERGELARGELVESVEPAERAEPPTPPGLLPPLNPAPTAAEIRAVLDARRGYPPRAHPILWVAAGVVACAVILLVTFAILRASDSWDEDHRSAVIDMKSKAEALAAAGKLQEAHEEYRELDKLIGGRDVHDPELKRLVDSARVDQDRIYHSLLAGVLDKNGPRPRAVAIVPSMNVSRPAAVVPKVALVPSIGTQAFQPPGRPTRSTDSTDSTSSPRASSPRASSRREQPAGSGGQPVPASGPSTTPAAPPPAPPVVTRPAPRPVPEDRQALTDERIGQSIQSGVNYLFARFNNRHVLRGSENNDPAWQCGEDALAVYALLQCGEAINDPRLNIRGPEMKALIDAMKQLPIEGSYQTYARGIRATALALFDRPEDFAALKNDADWLMETCDEGAYTYANRTLHDPPSFRNGWGTGPPRGAWDNSNSQYGLLGVWSAVEAEPRIEVPLAYWRAVERHWTNCQEPDGEWGYNRGGGRLTMTCAGIASLFVTHEYLDPATGSAEPVGRDPFSPPLKKGLDWFEDGDHVITQQGGYWGYRLYGIERVGLASGFKYFGRHDWYREFATEILAQQNGDGAWRDGAIDTSYALLFLARGRHPILMNKLRFDGYWANRPRDAANLARYTGRQLERPLNWQVINIKTDWTDWTDSPILYVASHEAPKLTDDDIDRIRDFVNAGGLLFTHADAGSEAFNVFATQLAHRLFPNYEMADLPANHLIYTVNFKPDPRPPLKYVTNGARVLMVHSPTDLSTHWQKREDRQWEGGHEADPAYKGRQLAPFQIAANLFIYAAGKRDLRNRLETTWVPPVNAAPLATIKVARLQYAGNWDPEPAAWQRYANWFQRQTGYRLDIQTEKLKDLKPGDATLADLTGTARTLFTPEEVAAVKAYVEAGGVLLVDMAGGTGQFDQSASNSLLTPAFPAGFPNPLFPSHPVLNAGAPGMDDLSHPRLRSFAIERFGHSGIFPYYQAAGKGHVIATNLDLTCGLLNADTWGIIGYEPAYAQALVKNVLFWALDGQPEGR